MGRDKAGLVWLCLLATGLSAPAALPDDGQLDAALAAVRADEARRVEVFARAAKSVVCIFGDRERGGGGSGVVIDPAGYGLTNFHVVQPFIKTRLGYGGLSDGRLYSLKVLGIDPGGDIVMFKLEGKPQFDYAPLADSDLLRVGQRVAAMGNPFVLAEDNQPTITLGIISGLHRYQEGQGNLLEYADCIQVSTSINPGNSGGPLFDLEGRVIGINGRASFEERGRVNVGLGFAVSINQIKRFMPGLRCGRMQEHGTLGATVRTVGDDLIVSAVQAFSPAEKAGVQLGDALREVAGRRVRTPNDYNNIIATLPANWPVMMKLSSNGRPVDVMVRLERLPLRLPLTYLLDMEHNHAELKAVLDRHSRTTRECVEGELSQVVFRGRVRAGVEAAERECELVFTLDDAVTEGDSSLLLEAVVREEWRRLCLPLLTRPRIDLKWEMLAGDEVDGRIVNVIEYRPRPESRVRWKFDWQSDELLQVTFGDREEPEMVYWTPASPGRRGGLDWPSEWTRRAGDELLVIEFDSVTLESNATKTVGDGARAEDDK